MVLLPLLFACSGPIGPLFVPCDPDPAARVDLPLGDPTVFGTTGEDLLAAARVGSVHVEWSTRRHDVVPDQDTLRVEIEPAGLVSEDLLAPVEPDAAAWCEDLSSIHLPVAGRVWTADGTVSAQVTGTITGDADGYYVLQVSGPVALSDERRAVVDARLDDHLDPPEGYALHLRTSDRPMEVLTAGILAEGPNYGVHVWICDSQRDPACLTW